MVLRQEHESLRALLVETVTILCKNGLKFRKKFNIEGLLGLTIDDGEVVLIKLDEVVRSDQEVDSKVDSPMEAKHALPVAAVAERPPPPLQFMPHKVMPSLPAPPEVTSSDSQTPATAPSSSSRRKRTNPQPVRRPPQNSSPGPAATNPPASETPSSVVTSSSFGQSGECEPPPAKRLMGLTDINQNTPDWPKLMRAENGVDGDHDDVELTRQAYISSGGSPGGDFSNHAMDEEDSIGPEFSGGEWREAKLEQGELLNTSAGANDAGAGVGTKYEVQAVPLPNGVVKKVFICLEENCHLTFSSYANWAQHTATIHQGIVYVCAHCSASFTRLGTLRKHCEKYHQNRLNWTKGVRTPKSSQAKNSKNKTPQRGVTRPPSIKAEEAGEWEGLFKREPINIEPMDMERVQQAVLAQQAAGTRVFGEAAGGGSGDEDKPLNMTMTSSAASPARRDVHERTMSALVNRLNNKVKQMEKDGDDELMNNNSSMVDAHLSVQSAHA